MSHPVRHIEPTDRGEWMRMRAVFWPRDPGYDDHEADITHSFHLTLPLVISALGHLRSLAHSYLAYCLGSNASRIDSPMNTTNTRVTVSALKGAMISQSLSLFSSCSA